VYTPPPQWAKLEASPAQMPFPAQGQQTGSLPFWQSPSQTEQQAPSYLPVPYQGQQAVLPFTPDSDRANNALMPLTEQNIHVRPPALPDEAVYVPPMYTKPRPIIPRYRAISGLLSVLIVAILLCAGAGYYARASGKLSAVSRFVGLASPSNIRPTPTAVLTNAPIAQVTGAAYTIISSATTTASINSQGVATETDTVFKPNQPIYLTYSVHPPKKPGVLIIKWYTGGAFYQASTPQTIKTAIFGRTQVAYAVPSEGMVELYWNNQLAIRLYFVVR
jgi:hypothetical protein